MMKVYDGCLPLNFKMLVSGSSSTGKSTFVSNILANDNGLMEFSFEKVVYLQGVETLASKALQSKYGKNMIAFKGIPKEDVLLPLCKNEERTVLIIEDLDELAYESSLVSKIFKAYSHHLGFSVIMSTQNMFCAGKERLTLVRNATHLVLFPNYLDLTVVRLVAQRVHPENPKALVRLFDSLVSRPYGYLSVWGNCQKELRFRAKITDGPLQEVYTLLN